jgi:hypothetical protein
MIRKWRPKRSSLKWARKRSANVTVAGHRILIRDELTLRMCIERGVGITDCNYLA